MRTEASVRNKIVVGNFTLTAFAGQKGNQHRRANNFPHHAVQPPSTLRSDPVTKDAASESKNKTGPTISLAAPIRPNTVLAQS